MHDGRHGKARERAVYGLGGVTLRQLGIIANPRLVKLDDVGAGFLQIQRFRVDRFSKSHRELFFVGIEFVLGLLAHRERPGQRDLGEVIGVATKKLHVSQFNRACPADFIHHARHRAWPGPNAT
jgi:hypothetical protein